MGALALLLSDLSDSSSGTSSIPTPEDVPAVVETNCSSG